MPVSRPAFSLADARGVAGAGGVPCSMYSTRSTHVRGSGSSQRPRRPKRPISELYSREWTYTGKRVGKLGTSRTARTELAS